MQERKKEAWAKWRGLVSEQGSSGSASAFCRERGPPVSQFFAWKRRLRQAATEAFVELRVTKAAAQPAAAQISATEIRLGCGRSVLVEAGFDAVPLRAVLAVLEARA